VSSATFAAAIAKRRASSSWAVDSPVVVEATSDSGETEEADAETDCCLNVCPLGCQPLNLLLVLVLVLQLLLLLLLQL
jgi:hypothetical protein